MAVMLYHCQISVHTFFSSLKTTCLGWQPYPSTAQPYQSYSSYNFSTSPGWASLPSLTPPTPSSDVDFTYQGSSLPCQVQITCFLCQSKHIASIWHSCVRGIKYNNMLSQWDVPCTFAVIYPIMLFYMYILCLYTQAYIFHTWCRKSIW